MVSNEIKKTHIYFLLLSSIPPAVCKNLILNQTPIHQKSLYSHLICGRRTSSNITKNKKKIEKAIPFFPPLSSAIIFLLSWLNAEKILIKKFFFLFCIGRFENGPLKLKKLMIRPTKSRNFLEPKNSSCQHQIGTELETYCAKNTLLITSSSFLLIYWIF